MTILSKTSHHSLTRIEWMDVMRAKYRSKFNLSNAYEQVRVELDNVWKMVFAIIFRTFVSQVMQ